MKTTLGGGFFISDIYPKGVFKLMTASWLHKRSFY